MRRVDAVSGAPLANPPPRKTGPHIVAISATILARRFHALHVLHARRPGNAWHSDAATWSPSTNPLWPPIAAVRDRGALVARRTRVTVAGECGR